MLHTAYVNYEETARVISPTTKWPYFSEFYSCSAAKQIPCVLLILLVQLLFTKPITGPYPEPGKPSPHTLRLLSYVQLGIPSEYSAFMLSDFHQQSVYSSCTNTRRQDILKVMYLIILCKE